jgi:AcrR family transcriptional regulator
MSHAACRRQLILEAAERLLSHYGASKTTVADIAREAEVGVGTVYLEFPSKDAIVEALASERHARVLGAMREAASKRAPFASRLRLIFEARVKTQLALSRGGTHAGELVHCASPAMRQCGQRFVAEQTLLLVSFLAEATSGGEFDVAEPEQVARTLLRCYASFSPPWLFDHPEAELQAALAAMHNLVLRGVLKRLAACPAVKILNAHAPEFSD